MRDRLADLELRTGEPGGREAFQSFAERCARDRERSRSGRTSRVRARSAERQPSTQAGDE